MEYIPLLISGLALLFSAYQFVKATEKEDTSQITTVLIKLEGIAEGITEIKSDIRTVKDDIKELRERVAKVEASASSAHKRIDRVEGKDDLR